MSYVAKVLQPGETVRYVTGLHWFVYLHAIGFAILAIGAVVLALQLIDPTGQLAALVLAAALALAAAIAWLRGFIQRRTTEIAVTDRRIIYKRGLLRRDTVEMNMSKVESVNVDQSIAGRIFGYGTVTIHGTGGDLEPMRNIAAPIRFRNHVTAA
ncbi:MAG TPA: PH domain-containing protein [Stellaceae bacterium]|nr:PH domain-containing protein [Stellaceae bacterium]